MFTKEDLKARILSNVEVAPSHFLMELAVSRVFRNARPGQFVMLRPAGRGVPFLGRPLGIYSLADHGDGARIEVLYRAAGRGTQVISTLCEGERMEILGPLGNSFEFPPAMDTAVLVAGGIGIAPLVFLARQLSCRSDGVRVVVYIGARDAGTLLGVDRVKVCSAEVRLCTDDGSTGYRGPVTDLFREDLGSFEAAKTAVFVCGPGPMLRRVSEIVADHPVFCQVLMEERMACGMGACLGCTIEVKSRQGVQYRQVCTDGPVFDIREIVWR
ncbi:MAG: Dihydroorotate dehydrogenase B (NAD(+)), electron transfer subunit [Syntrophaceae bacterium PtaB.Bin038]|nr:MAG: Dihydroorotate dehydrogenase B (NAD(+)), electron transfer subunit [Syntrophaceae bacterium PtaB.Bin038]